MKTREKISLKDSVQDVIVKMSEGNPGAINVLIQLYDPKDPETVFEMLQLDDMNIRGSQIWVGFKDFAGGDMKKFRAAIRSRDREMLHVINMEDPEGPRATAHRHERR